MNMQNRNWLGRLSDRIGKLDNQPPGGQSDDFAFNPLSWGVLFFSLWLSLKTVDSVVPLGPFQRGLANVAIVVSIVMLVSTPFTNWLRNKLQTIIRNASVLPVIYVITVFVYTIGFLTVVPSLKGPDVALAITIGFLWLVAYGMVALSRLKYPMTRLRMCLVVLVMFIVSLTTTGISGSWPLLVVLALFVLPALKPSWFRTIPLV